ncbi:penicillin-insensitive murein endopeptidase [Pasteurellaceae bacterium 20609_3]|uniref:penicillin-insensitive murein endopeptidase n=1 Tax=Spirabiliibacterium mucosae TaxID=28156 RepID=UPI001AADF22F|nr:penicillin-insensitive murein endopeptidase [Spirabiliibacterium mucosae]
MKWTTALATLALTALLTMQSAVAETEWQKIKRPIPGEALPVGGYSNGCIIGAQPLAWRGEGYQVIRMQKNRYYGHPMMIRYLQDLGKRVKQAGLPTMLVGDIAMPGGGRFLTGHASHQIGLDADIWLRFGPLSDKEARTPVATLMVDRARKVVDERVWTNGQTTMLKLASQDPRVARIFVNPAIKVKLCQSVRGDRSWLRKIRPWFGHDAHFHVRLHCPGDAKYCQEQAPIPAGEGCGAELYSWFEPPKPSVSKPKKAPPALPALCQQVLDAPDKHKWLQD